MENSNINNNNTINTEIIPLIKYTNAYSSRSLVCKENKNKSGVYRWVNNTNGKSYLGSSVSLSSKFSIYYSLNSLKKIKGSIIIYRAILKYGYSNFSIDILEYCEPALLKNREQYYIDLLKPEYNII